MEKREHSKPPRIRLVADQAKPVPLNVAASIVHQQLSGSSRTWKDETYSAILDSTALALSHVSDICYVDAQGKLRRIPDEELAVGMFEGGARVFRTRSGNAYESLFMRRGDMSEAITVLKNARGALHAASEAKAGVRKP
ncbi:MAG TPA: hypothetical protein VFR66_03040 [Burkholderiales bacterium]|nr:hypothetical protein [Burkholderiales bacterium]